MAKKKKGDGSKKKDKGGKKKDQGVKQGPVGQELERDFTRGNDLAQRFLPSWEDIFQFNPVLDSEYGNTLNQLGGLAGMDPNNMGAYAGAVTPEIQDAIEKYKGNIEYSSDIQDIIGRMKGGLEGYAAPELAAMRETQARQNKRTLQSTMRDIQNSGARSGLGGAARALQNVSASNEAGRKSQDLEQELFIKNADEKQKRLQTFGGFMTEQEAAKQRRLGDYSSFLSSEQGNAYNRGADARKAYQDWLNTMHDNEVQRQMYNVGQQDKQKAAQTAGVLGMAGALQAGRNKKWMEKFMKDNPYDPRPVAQSGGGGGYDTGMFGALQELMAKLGNVNGTPNLGTDTGATGG